MIFFLLVWFRSFSTKSRTTRSPFFKHIPINASVSSSSQPREAFSLYVNLSFVILFSILPRVGPDEFCCAPLPQICPPPKRKVDLNTCKLSRLFLLINITTSRAEMLQSAGQGVAPAVWAAAGLCSTCRANSPWQGPNSTEGNWEEASATLPTAQWVSLSKVALPYNTHKSS